MRWREKVVDFFGLKKSVAALLFMVILVGLGEKMAERFCRSTSSPWGEASYRSVFSTGWTTFSPPCIPFPAAT
jgi:hypothetical protein